MQANNFFHNSEINKYGLEVRIVQLFILQQNSSKIFENLFFSNLMYVGIRISRTCEYNHVECR